MTHTDESVPRAHECSLVAGLEIVADFLGCEQRQIARIGQQLLGSMRIYSHLRVHSKLGRGCCEQEWEPTMSL